MLALVFAAALAGAPGAVLWRDITAGMPESRLRERYPEAKGSVTYHKDWAMMKDAFAIGSCHANVEIVFKLGAVTSVGIWSKPNGFPARTCGDDVQTALTGKYGQPATQNSDTQPAPGATIKSLHYIWKSGETVIDFSREDINTSDTWHVRYTAAANADL